MTAERDAFLGETRGDILRLIHTQTSTVNELAAALALTDNAIRAHLAALQTEGLVVTAGQRQGARKPHIIYSVTDRGRELLSRLYIPVLQGLLQVMKDRLPPGQQMELLIETGRRLAGTVAPSHADQPLAGRLQKVMGLLTSLGADATASPEPGGWVIEGKACPLSAVVSHYPNACKVLEQCLSDWLGVAVTECCIKNSDAPPRCRFHIPASA